jgi:glutamate-1-semialdehyde 2,1-aminomutase
LAEKHQIKAKMQGRGGHFHWYFTDEEIVDYRSAAKSDKDQYAAFIQTFSANGVYCSPNFLLHHAVSMAHTDQIIEQLIAYMDESLKKAVGIKAGS